MKRIVIVLITLACLVGCKTNNSQWLMLMGETPDHLPIPFKSELTPGDRIIHKGMFSPDLKAYYYTLSDKDLSRFDVYVTRFENGNWSAPKEAHFNSAYNEHGMSFSPDGESVFFSSTRHVDQEGVADTWHIWRSDLVAGQWSDPVFVDITNLRNRLVSHPTVAADGTLYFHVSNLDYSEMDIFVSELENGHYSIAKKIDIDVAAEVGRCTPFIAADEEYIIYAVIGDQLDLMISYTDGNGGWSNSKKFSDQINSYGQGNPFVTPDGQFLFFTTSEESGEWQVKWVSTEGVL